MSPVSYASFFAMCSSGIFFCGKASAVATIAGKVPA
jgi:hypothetical protein